MIDFLIENGIIKDLQAFGLIGVLFIVAFIINEKLNKWIDNDKYK